MYCYMHMALLIRLTGAVSCCVCFMITYVVEKLGHMSSIYSNINILDHSLPLAMLSLESSSAAPDK